MQIINGSFKTKKSRVFWKISKFKFSKLVKSIVFSCLRANKTIGCQSTAYALRYRRGKQVFVKENEKKYV